MSLSPASTLHSWLKEGLYAAIRGSVPKGKDWFGVFSPCILIALPVHLALFAEGAIVIKKRISKTPTKPEQTNQQI